MVVISMVDKWSGEIKGLKIPVKILVGVCLKDKIGDKLVLIIVFCLIRLNWVGVSFGGKD